MSDCPLWGILRMSTGINQNKNKTKLQLCGRRGPPVPAPHLGQRTPGHHTRARGSSRPACPVPCAPCGGGTSSAHQAPAARSRSVAVAWGGPTVPPAQPCSGVKAGDGFDGATSCGHLQAHHGQQELLRTCAVGRGLAGNPGLSLAEPLHREAGAGRGELMLCAIRLRNGRGLGEH